MSNLAGLRDVQVFNNATSGVLVTPSVYAEVTNNSGADVLIYINDSPNTGHPTQGIARYGIPVKTGTTREIPMRIYNFSSTGAVTVVAYMP